MAGRRSPDSVARSLSACALRSQEARGPSPKSRLKGLPMSLSSTLLDRTGLGFEGASNSAPLLGRRRTSAPPPGRRPRSGPGVQERRPLTSSAVQEGALRFPTLSATFSSTLPSKAQQLLKQRKKAAKQQVSEVMKFDDVFDIACRRAVQRTAAERKMLSQLPIQVVNSGSPMCVRELLGLKQVPTTSLFTRRRSKEESAWGTEVLSRIPGSKEEVESNKTGEGRRKSSIQQSFTSFGDVVIAAQAAARKETMDGSPRSVKGGESRRNSFRRGSIAEETVARLLRRSAFSDADLKDEFELLEILDPPAPSQMYTRFKVEDISSFPASEQERIREAFYRFKSIGSSDIDVDDLEKALIHLGYLKIDAQAILEITQKLTKFATLDFEEYLRFMGSYTSYERAEVQRVFREFDEDGSGSLDTEEIEGVMRSFGITPFKSTVEAAIAVVDEDHTGTVEFHEFVHLLTVYKKTEGFSQAEVRDLYAVFYKFAVSLPGSKLREVPEGEMRSALMNLFGPQTLSMGIKLVNEVLVQMQKKKEEKAAKRALSRQQGGRDLEEQGMKFREFLVWARRLREAEIARYRRKFNKANYLKTGLLQQDDLQEAFRHFGYTALRADVEDLLERQKVPKDETIDFERFVGLVQDFCRTDGFCRRDVDEFFEVFRAFDTAGLGEVGVLEIASILRWMGFSIELEVADSYFQSVNLDGSDHMGFAEFLRLMRLHRDDCLSHLKDVFDRNCENDAVLKQDCLKQVLTQMDRRVSVSVISQCLQGVKDSRYIDFDDFVQVTDNMRRQILSQMRKQAGFTDEEVKTFMQAFDKYDTDGNRKLTRDEMPPLLADMKIDLRTVEDQKHFVRLLEEARLSARRGGATEDEVGAPGTPGITFWNFVHFLRVLQTEDDVQTVENKARSHVFSENEQKELRIVFNTWCDHAEDAGRSRASESESESEALEPSLERTSSEAVTDSGLKLPHRQLWRLLRELGIPLTPTHQKILKARAALDAENTLPVEERGSFINCSGFFRLLSWMLDSNFACIRERSEELADNPPSREW